MVKYQYPDVVINVLISDSDQPDTSKQYYLRPTEAKLLRHVEAI